MVAEPPAKSQRLHGPDNGPDMAVSSTSAAQTIEDRVTQVEADLREMVRRLSVLEGTTAGKLDKVDQHAQETEAKFGTVDQYAQATNAKLESAEAKLNEALTQLFKENTGTKSALVPADAQVTGFAAKISGIQEGMRGFGGRIDHAEAAYADLGAKLKSWSNDVQGRITALEGAGGTSAPRDVDWGPPASHRRWKTSYRR